MTDRRPKISLIVPCKDEHDTLELLYSELRRVIDPLSCESEMLFVDDGSCDGTLAVMRALAESDEGVKYISFSRNFGKEAAIYAGLCNATGDYVAILDADMQDPPSLLPEMLRLIEMGEFDCVAARRCTRDGEPILRSWLARRFYGLARKLMDVDLPDGARDFRLMKRSMVDAIVSMSERNRFSKGLFEWIGFKTYWLPYENFERVEGNSKWSTRALFGYAIGGIIDYSEVPLHIATWAGLLVTLLAFVFLALIIVRRLLFGDPVAGWASMICVVLFLGGLQFLLMGIMGQYIAKSYTEVKQRPHYIVAETNDANVLLVQ